MKCLSFGNYELSPKHEAMVICNHNGYMMSDILHPVRKIMINLAQALLKYYVEYSLTQER